MDKIAIKALSILNEYMPEHNIGSNDLDEKLTNLNLDSIAFIRIIIALEEEFDIEIPDEKLLLTEMNTISKMTEVISDVLNHQNSTIGE